MKKKILLISSVLLILLAMVLSVSTLVLPAARPADADVTLFSGDRAMKHVDAIAKETHIIGSQAQHEARAYIVAQLESMGLTPLLQEGYVSNDESGFLGLVPYKGEAQNIVVRIPGNGSSGENSVLLVAHYDSTLGGAGAADDASGSAVLLETARALLAGPGLTNDVILLFADGEEAGLLGSKMFAADDTLCRNIGIVLNFEGRGSGGPSMLFETSKNNGSIVPSVLERVPGAVAYSFTLDAYTLAPNITDLTPFLDAGLAGLNFANLSGTEIYHMPEDMPERLDPAFLQHQGEYAIALAKHFGNHADSADTNSGNTVFFTVARGLTLWYPTTLTPILTIAALALCIAAFIFARRYAVVTKKQVLCGAGATLLAVGISTLAGFAASLLFSALYFRLDVVQTFEDLLTLKRSILAQNNLWIGVSLMGFAVLHLLIGRYFYRKIGKYGMLLGNLTVWAVAAIVSAVLLPSAQYIFLWPLAGCAIGLLTEVLRGRQASCTTCLYPVFAGVSCILIFLPVGYILFQALMMSGGGIAYAILSLPVATLSLAFCLFLPTKNPENKSAA